MQEEMSVAEMLVYQMEQAGIERLYSIIGDSLNPFGAAIAKSSIEWVSVRHEECAAFAAGGEAFASGKICACAGTCGPGSVHLINGLYEANRNQVPVLALVTHIPSSEIGLQYFQEIHPLKLFEDCSVFCEMLSSPDQLPRLSQAAIQTAISKKGVAMLVVPGDIAKMKVKRSALMHAPILQKPRLYPEQSAVNKLADLLNAYDNITIYCGYGCKNAMPEVLALSESLNAPIIYTLRAKEFAEYNNPYAVGMLGRLAWGSAEIAIKNCNCLLLLGTDLPYAGLLPTTPKVAQVDICGTHLGRRSKLDCGVIGDMKTTLDILLPLINNKGDNVHLRKSLKFAHKVEEKMGKELILMSKSDTLRPEYLTAQIDTLADENAIFVVDVGLNDIWVSRYLKATANRKILGSFKHGTMSAAIGAAIGMHFAEPEKQIVVLAGDGGLSMLLGDLLTVKTYQIPLKIIVYNNLELGYINLEAKQDGYEPFATELENPDFAKIAQDIGIKSFEICKNSQINNVLERAFREEGAVLINAMTDKTAIGELK